MTRHARCECAFEAGPRIRTCRHCGVALWTLAFDHEPRCHDRTGRWT